MFVPGKFLEPSLIFAGKADGLLALHTNIRLSWTLAYYENS
jgi:hypothetical protein